MGAKVYSIERHQTLYQKTTDLLSRLNYNRVHTFFGDGYKGLPAYAPFDKILITAAAPHIPEALLQQLKIGGKMVVPLNKDNDIQEMTLITKKDDTHLEVSQHGDFRFVPMLKNRE